MGFPKLSSRRLHKKSPYASDAENQDDRNNAAAGKSGAVSSISLPTLLSPRSYTSQSNYSTGSSGDQRDVHPGEALMKTLDSVAPPLVPRSKPKKHPPPRARSFYSTLNSDIEMSTSSFERQRRRHGHGRRPSDNAASPTALPMKAMALLGFEEQKGFGFSAVSSPSLQSSREKAEDGYCSIDEDDEDDDDEDWGAEEREDQQEAMDKVKPMGSSPELLAPDRLYFRPESLCSSFTSSEHTDTTTVTTMTPTSPSLDDPANGTLDSNSTLKGLTMLNLDDSDDEEQAEPEEKHRGTSAADLPPEIALQICDYFSTPTHHDDLLLNDPATTRCPNCELYALWSLSQVSRNWNKAANTVLYRDISLDLGYYTPLREDTKGNLISPQYIKYTKCEGIHTLDDVEQKLRQLYNTIWRSQGEVGERIRGIKLPRRMLPLMKYPLLAILQKCPNLEYIDQAVVSSGEADSKVSLLLGMKNMQRWTIAREASVKKEKQFIQSRGGTLLTAPPPRIVTEVLPVWSQLKQLDLKKCQTIDIPTEFDFGALPSLESVRFEQTVVADRAFFVRLPRLKKLAIVDCPRTRDLAVFVVEYLQRAGGEIETLELQGFHFSTPLLHELLQHAPQIRALAITDTTITARVDENRTPPTLKKLKTLHIDMDPILDSIRFVLDITEEREKVPSLKRIHIGFKTAGYEPEPMLTETGNRGSTVLDEAYKMLLRIRMNCLWSRVEVVI